MAHDSTLPKNSDTFQVGEVVLRLARPIELQQEYKEKQRGWGRDVTKSEKTVKDR